MTKNAFMKKRRHSQPFFGAILIGLSTMASATVREQSFCQSPYLGVDLQQRDLKLVSGYGQNGFDKRVPQYNLYAGLMFNEYIGIEIGQEFTQNVTRTSLALPGVTLGAEVPNGTFDVNENKIKLYGSNVNVVGKLPLNIGNLHLLASAGVVSLKIKAETKALVFGGAQVLDPDTTILVFSTRRVISRFAAGIGCQITKSIRVRALIGYETTSQFKNLAPLQQSTLRMSLKNNVTGGIGVDFTL